jgi:ATP-dependent helicase/nuclease subunit A
VIVEYKTDDAPDAALASRVGYYAPQLNAYRAIVETAIDRPTAAPVFVFTRQTSALSLEVSG